MSRGGAEPAAGDEARREKAAGDEVLKSTKEKEKLRINELTGKFKHVKGIRVNESRVV